MIQHLPLDAISIVTTGLTPLEVISIVCSNKALLTYFLHIIVPYLFINENKISTKEFKTFMQVYLKKRINQPYEARYTIVYFSRTYSTQHCTMQLYKAGKVCKRKELTQAIKKELSLLPLRRVRKLLTDSELEALIISMYGKPA